LNLPSIRSLTLAKLNLNVEIAKWRSVGECLSGGDIVLSPFELPIEEERRGDPDQADDNYNFVGQDNLCVSLEPFLTNGKKSVADIKLEEERFRFFLDGSIRTKYIGEYVEGSLSFPIVVSEIAVGVVRKDQKKLVPCELLKRLYFIFPHKDSNLVADSTYNRLEKMQARFEQTSSFTRIEFLKKADVAGDVRNSMLGKVRNIMHKMEHEVAQKLPKADSDWLIMDGAIREYEFLHLENTIGVAKSFSRKPVFSIGQGKLLTLSAYMRNLKDGERSSVFIRNSPNDPILNQVMFWYVRIRTFPPMEPLGGIVKIDMKLPKSKELSEKDSEGIDSISSEIFHMKSPTVYPWPRWPNYIYPIRTAEMYMSSTFLSPFSLSQIGQEMKSMMEKSMRR
jgi:hypothetical protein